MNSSSREQFSNFEFSLPLADLTLPIEWKLQGQSFFVLALYGAFVGSESLEEMERNTGCALIG